MSLCRVVNGAYNRRGQHLKWSTIFSAFQLELKHNGEIESISYQTVTL